MCEILIFVIDNTVLYFAYEYTVLFAYSPFAYTVLCLHISFMTQSFPYTVCIEHSINMHCNVKKENTHILIYSILFCSVLFCSIIIYSIQFHSILFHSILFHSILFYFTILLYYILLYYIIFYSFIFYSTLFYSILFTVLFFTQSFNYTVLSLHSLLPTQSFANVLQSI
jgi:hypothetical protein